MAKRSRAQAGTSGGRRVKLFWNGRSQAVRLPKEFRFDGDEILVRREGEAVLLEAIPKTNWPASYWTRAGLRFAEPEPLKGGLLEIS
jgi:virulence-associated protein VagC